MQKLKLPADLRELIRKTEGRSEYISGRNLVNDFANVKKYFDRRNRYKKSGIYFNIFYN